MDYIEKAFPSLKQHISHNLSPVATISKYIKETDPDARVVFIGPCTAKKAEFQKERVRPYIDSVITFEELQALFDSRDLVIESLPETILDNASYFGRIFARSGGLTDAVRPGAHRAWAGQNLRIPPHLVRRHRAVPCGPVPCVEERAPQQLHRGDGLAWAAVSAVPAA